MLTVSNVELRFGARVLMSDVSFRVDKGDKIGLVGRNGAGKTTLTRMLSGDGQPAEGSITSTGKIGYLPQDPKSGDLDDDRPRPHPRRPRPRHRADRDAQGRARHGLAGPRHRREGDEGLHACRHGVRRRRWLCRRVGGGDDRPRPRPAGPGARAAAVDPLGRTASTHRARTHPVLRRRHPAARRADQPPGRRLGGRGCAASSRASAAASSSSATTSS